MAIKTKAQLKAYFTTGSKPTQAQFEDLIDSTFNDTIACADISNKPTWIGTTKPSYSWSEISSKPSWIGSTKPSYA